MGNQSVRHRKRFDETDWGHENGCYDLKISCLLAIKMFTSCLSNIDVHDYRRQESLALEKNWNKKT